MSPLFQMEGALTLVAKVDGKMAACAAGLVIQEHGIVALFGAGTLSEYRRRGLQTALLETRMAVAAKAGCEFAVIVTQGGTTSQRNAERLGFPVAYSKATMLKSTSLVSLRGGLSLPGCAAPFFGIDIGGGLSERPAMAAEVFNGILPFTIGIIVRRVENFCAVLFGAIVVAVQVTNAHHHRMCDFSWPCVCA